MNEPGSYIVPEDVILSLEETIYRALYKHKDKDALVLAHELQAVVLEFYDRAREGHMKKR